MKIIETKVQKRFADVDMFLHVNNVHQQEYLDLGKSDYYRQVIGLNSLTASPTLMIVSVKSDFVNQVRWDDEVFVRTWVERIGTKSITIRQQIVVRKSGEVSESEITGDGLNLCEAAECEVVCTEGETVLVCFDLRQGTAVDVPEKWREKIEK